MEEKRAVGGALPRPGPQGSTQINPQRQRGMKKTAGRFVQKATFNI